MGSIPFQVLAPGHVKQFIVFFRLQIYSKDCKNPFVSGYKQVNNKLSLIMKNLKNRVFSKWINLIPVLYTEYTLRRSVKMFKNIVFIILQRQEI